MVESINDFPSLSAVGYSTFRNELAGIVEKGDWIVGALFSLRPFESIEDYYAKLCQFIDQLPISAQVGIINCQNHLLTISTAKMSKLSFKEQTTRFKDISASNDAHIQELNKQYYTKFEFPFVCCVRENSVESILDQLKNRIANTYQEEVTNNIFQIKRIAWYRLKDKFGLKSKL